MGGGHAPVGRSRGRAVSQGDLSRFSGDRRAYRPLGSSKKGRFAAGRLTGQGRREG